MDWELGSETWPKELSRWYWGPNHVFINSNDFQDINFDPSNSNQSILRGENNTLLRSDGGNCNNGFAGTPFFLPSPLRA